MILLTQMQSIKCLHPDQNIRLFMGDKVFLMISPILAQTTNVACLRIEEVIVRVDGLMRHSFA